MSIFPSTDIISDVSRAADPQRARLAMRRLEEAAKGPTNSEVALVTTMRSSGAAAPVKGRPTDALRTDAASADRSNETAPAARAAQKFEAFILQIWLEALLPKEVGEAFGSDSAGGAWRSMMAEQLGAQLASVGGIGLQKLIGGKAASETTSA